MVLLQCSCLLMLHCFLRELQEAGVAPQKVNSRVRHFGMVFVFLVVKATLAVLGWYCRLPAASDGSSRQQIFALGRCPPATSCWEVAGTAVGAAAVAAAALSPPPPSPSPRRATGAAAFAATLAVAAPSSPSPPAPPPHPSSSPAYRPSHRRPRRCRHCRRYARHGRPIAAAPPLSRLQPRGGRAPVAPSRHSSVNFMKTH